MLDALTPINEINRVRSLIMRHGWNATSFQLVNPGIEHWFSSGREGVVGFVRRSGVRVVAGAPVCATDDLEAVVDEWESAAMAAGDRVCYFGAAGRMRDVAAERGEYSSVILGAQPVWDPAAWQETVQGDPALRAQFNRAKNKGVIVREWSSLQAQDSPHLRRCLTEWLGTRGLPPLHFLVEPQTLERLTGRRVFVAERNNVPVGFVVLSPVPLRQGWMTEQFVRGQDAPNGAVELMLDAAARAVAADGANYLTMGLVPLSHLPGRDRDPNPMWLRFILGWVRAHGRRFYNFRGLDAFKSKFHPHYWEPIYALSNERRFSFRTLYAIGSAFSGDRSPVAAVASGMGKAVRKELAWLTGGRRER